MKNTGSKKDSGETSTYRSYDTEHCVAVSKASRRDDRYEKSDFPVQWDPQEGLMPQIMSLISSPRKDVRKKKNNILIIGSSRICDSCKEQGDLVCCSLCNCSFHTLCHNPPLDDDNLPTSKWSCYRCSQTSTYNARDYEEDAKSSKASATATSESDQAPQLGYAFNFLLKAIEHDNSEEFQLTKEVSLPVVFSGYGKPTKKRLKQMKLDRLDQGIVSSPVRVCFTCERSSRKGPLLHCDFCPLMFHLDCLNPPLTTMPLSRWMCPNHPNHTVDEKMLTDRHTERIKLWDEYCCNPVTEQKVMLDFFHKNSRKNPPFFKKRVIEPDIVTVSIPSHIKAMYKAAVKRREQSNWLDGVISMNPQVLDFDNLTVNDLSETTVKLLATRMLTQLQPQKREAQKIVTVSPKAFITPGLGSSGPQLYITQDHITIGKCSSADINLEFYGPCKYASAKHAVVFFDKVTQCFELMNYSQHGTHVDGISFNNNVEHILKESRSLTQNIKAAFKEKKKNANRPPMKRGRKSKAEKAAMVAAAAHLRTQAEDKRLLNEKSTAQNESKKKLKKNGQQESAINSEETVSVAEPSQMVVPKSENSDLEGIGETNTDSTVKNETNPHHDESTLGDINGPPKECICDLNNLMGKQQPAEGYEGTAILHNGSVLKFGCIVLLFNLVE